MDVHKTGKSYYNPYFFAKYIISFDLTWLRRIFTGYINWGDRDNVFCFILLSFVALIYFSAAYGDYWFDMPSSGSNLESHSQSR